MGSIFLEERSLVSSAELLNEESKLLSAIALSIATLLFFLSIPSCKLLFVCTSCFSVGGFIALIFSGFAEFKV